MLHNGMQPSPLQLLYRVSCRHPAPYPAVKTVYPGSCREHAAGRCEVGRTHTHHARLAVEDQGGSLGKADQQVGGGNIVVQARHRDVDGVGDVSALMRGRGNGGKGTTTKYAK